MTTEQQGIKRGGRTYTQQYVHAIPLATHAFRFYFVKPDATVDRMSGPTYAAWAACDVVYSDLLPTEQEIVRYYHTAKGNTAQRNIAMYRYASDHGASIQDVMQTVHSAWERWAIERGLADGDGNNTSRTDTSGTITSRTNTPGAGATRTANTSGTATSRYNTSGISTTRTGTAGPRMDNTTRTNTAGTAFPGTDFALPNKE